jgi:hypothetical protein
MDFTIETYAGAHKRICKQRDKALKKATVSPMAVDEVYRLADLHDRILKRLDRERHDWEWTPRSFWG